jgi:hypothetical protein
MLSKSSIFTTLKANRRQPSSTLYLTLRTFSTTINTKDPYDNIPDSILNITQRKIYKQEGHPLSTLIEKIEGFFNKG